MTVANNPQHVGPTKTHAAREIALDPIAVEVLKRRWTYMIDLSKRAESPLVDDPYVLSYNANGAVPANHGHRTFVPTDSTWRVARWNCQH